MARSKYGAKPQVVDGIRFASQKEARRYGELKLLEKAGEIASIEVQPEFPLHVHGRCANGVGPFFVGYYVADFRYIDRATQATVVEDTKGFRTPLYKWKKRHVEAQYGVQIRET